MKTCKQCNAEVADNLKFCGKCGAKLEETTNQPQNQPQTSEPKATQTTSPQTAETKQKKSLVLPIIAACIVGLLVFSFVNNREDKAAIVADKTTTTETAETTVPEETTAPETTTTPATTTVPETTTVATTTTAPAPQFGVDDLLEEFKNTYTNAPYGISAGIIGDTLFWCYNDKVYLFDTATNTPKIIKGVGVSDSVSMYNNHLYFFHPTEGSISVYDEKGNQTDSLGGLTYPVDNRFGSYWFIDDKNILAYSHAYNHDHDVWRKLTAPNYDWASGVKLPTITTDIGHGETKEELLKNIFAVYNNKAYARLTTNANKSNEKIDYYEIDLETMELKKSATDFKEYNKQIGKYLYNGDGFDKGYFINLETGELIKSSFEWSYSDRGNTYGYSFSGEGYYRQQGNNVVKYYGGAQTIYKSPPNTELKKYWILTPQYIAVLDKVGMYVINVETKEEFKVASY